MTPTPDARHPNMNRWQRAWQRWVQLSHRAFGLHWYEPNAELKPECSCGHQPSVESDQREQMKREPQ